MKSVVFSAPMVRAIIDGSKTQTRRAMNPQPEFSQHYEYKGKLLYECENRTWCWKNHISPNSWYEIDWLTKFAPYQPGCILHVMEAWAIYDLTCDPKYLSNKNEAWFYEKSYEKHMIDHVVYKADYDDGFMKNAWRSPIKMPSEAVRIFLRITDVGIERLQEISEADVISEGIIPKQDVECKKKNFVRNFHNPDNRNWIDDYIGSYESLWNSINTQSGYIWDSNPWVFVYTFERIGKDEANVNAK